MIPMLSKIGAVNYDSLQDINDLVVKIERIVNNLKKQWKTKDMEKIKGLVK